MNQRRRILTVLALIWVCFLCKGIFYSLLFPLWEGYDEYAHYAFIQYVALHGDLPVPSTRVSREVDLSLDVVPLPWVLKDWPPPHVTHDAYWKLSSEERHQRESSLRELPRSSRSEPGQSVLYEGQQGPLYYWSMATIYKVTEGLSLPDRVFLFRFLNVLLASSVIPLSFIIARHVLLDDAAAISVAVLIACMPEFYVDVARVGNQVLATVLYAVFALLLLKAMDGNNRYLEIAGVVLGLLLLTKAYTLAAVPAFVAAAIFCLRKTRRAALSGIVGAAAAFVMAGWWFWRNLVLTGSIIWGGGAPTTSVGLMGILRSIPRVDWLTATRALFAAHLWVGNWSFLTAQAWIYHVFEGLALVVAVGIAIKITESIRERKKKGSVQPANLLILLLLFVGLAATTAYQILTTFMDSGTGASEGWYIYAVVVPEAILVVAGLSAFKPGRWLVVSVACALVLFELFAVHGILIPYYTGLIRHTGAGNLQHFHPEHLGQIGLSELVARLGINRPTFEGPAILLLAWTAYLAASALLGCLAIYQSYWNLLIPIKLRSR